MPRTPRTRTRTRRRNYVFTLNSPTESETAHLQRLLREPDFMRQHNVRYIVFQSERGEGTDGSLGTLHYQGYVEFTASKRLGGAKSSLGSTRMHLEPRRGTQAEAIAYAKKEETRVVGLSGEAGTRARSRKDSLENVVEAFDEGTPITDVLQQHPIQALLHRQKIIEFGLHKKGRRDWKMEVEIFVGPTSTGKSYSARMENPEAYHAPWKMGQRWWWPNYQGEHTVILDEFRHQIKLDKLLKLLDYRPFHLEAKGVNFQFVSKKIVITTNIDPKDWYPNAKEDGRLPLERRIREFAKIYDFGPSTEFPNFQKNLRTERFVLNPRPEPQNHQEDFSTVPRFNYNPNYDV